MCVFQMGHNEEGLQAVDEIIRRYVHSCAWYLGPFYNMVRLFHPDYVKSLLTASGEKHIHDMNKTQVTHVLISVADHKSQ